MFQFLKGIDSLNDISVFNIIFYDKANPAFENIPMAFTYKGDPIYITIILSIIKHPPDPEPERSPETNTIYENELMKAMSSGDNGVFSKVVVKKKCL